MPPRHASALAGRLARAAFGVALISCAGAAFGAIQGEFDGRPIAPLDSAANPAAESALPVFFLASGLAMSAPSIPQSSRDMAYIDEAKISDAWAGALKFAGLLGKAKDGAPFERPDESAAALRFAALPSAVFRLNFSRSLGWGVQASTPDGRDCQKLLDLLRGANSVVMDGQEPSQPASCAAAGGTFFAPFATDDQERSRARGEGLGPWAATPAPAASKAASSASAAAAPAPVAAKADAALAQMATTPGLASTAAKSAASEAAAESSLRATERDALSAQSLERLRAAEVPPASRPTAAPPAQAAVASLPKIAAAKMAPPPAVPLPTAPRRDAELLEASADKAPAPLYWPGPKAAAFPKELYDDSCATDSQADRSQRAAHERERLAWIKKSGGAVFPGLN
jgi:hypothetical protein